jgi:hypothetical protein
VTPTTSYAPDALTSLRESFALHLDATRSAKTARIYLDALDSLTPRRPTAPVAPSAYRREPPL